MSIKFNPMKRYAKSTMLVAAGIVWLAAGLFIGLILFQNLFGGAGLPTLLGLSSFTVVIGLAQFTGFVAAACLCLIIGLGLCVHGLVPAPEPEITTPNQPQAHLKFWKEFIARACKKEAVDETLRCVSCQTGLSEPVHLCPKCGWTQPYERKT